MTMRRSMFATTLLCLAALPAEAQQCGAWSASMEEDEGGPQMMASVCNDHPANPGTLIVQCGGEDKLGFRYLPGYAASAPSDVPDFRGTFHLKSERGAADVELAYEGMDGAYAAYAPRAAALFKTLTSGNRLTISGPKGAFRPEAFSLKGASKAIAKVEAACKG